MTDKIKRYIVVYYTPDGLGPILHVERSYEAAKSWIGYLHINPMIKKIDGEYTELYHKILPEIIEVEFDNFNE